MPIYRHRVSGPGEAGDVWNSTVHSSSGQLIDVVHAAWVQWCTNFLANVMAPTWSLGTKATLAVTDELVPGTNTNAAQRESTLSIVGSAAGAPPNPRSSVVVGLRTAVPTRSGRGRMYIPAPTSGSMTSNGLLTTAAAASMSAGAAAAFGTLNATTQTVVFHRLTATSTPVTQITVGVVLGTQRRRTNKVPANYQVSAL